MPTSPAQLERFAAIDGPIRAAARGINVLGRLAWPRELQARFLEGWRRGNPILPAPDGVPRDHGALERIMAACDRAHPMGDHLYRLRVHPQGPGARAASSRTPTAAGQRTPSWR